MTIHVIIPHIGPDFLLQTCLQALERSQLDPASGETLSVRVVDNNYRRGPDGKPHAGRSLLFTESINLVLAKLRAGAIKAKPGDLVWILNNDALPLPGCTEAARLMFCAARVGMVASMNISPKDGDSISWGGSGEFWPVGRHKTGSRKAGERQARERQVWVPFASVFIRWEVIQQIGLLDPMLRHICSDADYCLRANEAGWEIWYEPDSRVLHGFGSSGASATWMNAVKAQDIRVLGLKWGLILPPPPAAAVAKTGG